jgi:hypothetical protein
MDKTTINKVIEQAILKPTKQAVAEATAKLLSEDIKVGQEVVSVDPETIVGGYVGKGRVKKLSNDPSGCAEVEFPNGTVVQAQVSLLVPV